MGFKLAPKKEIKTKVFVERLGDLGKVEKLDFVAIFKKLSTSDVKALTEEMRNGNRDENEVVSEHLIGWEGVLDEDREELPFNDVSLELMLDEVETRKALAVAFWKVQSGEVARKNS